MKIRFANDDEVARWDTLLANNPDRGSVFQTSEVAQAKAARGWIARYIMVDEVAVMVHERSVPILGKVWYCIKGPGLTTEEQLKQVVTSMRTFAKKNGVFVMKIEPELPKSDALHKAFSQNGYIQSRAIQPNSSTVCIDLTPSLDAILAGLNQKGRHAIRRAERDGVEASVVEYNEENARKMYTLFEETAKGRFRIREFDYYHRFWKAFADKERGALFFAHHEGKLVAAAFAMYNGTKGCYKDGASTREKTAYGASHLLQWKVIEWMKAHGVTQHDLCGAPPADRIHDTTHPHYGIGRFKTSFNKEVTEYIGLYDIAVKPFAYRIWSLFGERVLLRLYSALRHEYWY